MATKVSNGNNSPTATFDDDWESVSLDEFGVKKKPLTPRGDTMAPAESNSQFDSDKIEARSEEHVPPPSPEGDNPPQFTPQQPHFVRNAIQTLSPKNSKSSWSQCCERFFIWCSCFKPKKQKLED